MSNPSWQARLRQTLSRLNDQPPRVAIVGVGHELNGDDAAGLVVARTLQTRWAGQDRLLALEGGPAPENCTGVLRAFRPGLVLLVDAAHMGGEPGEVRWLAGQDTTGFSASTHTLPLHMLSFYLTAELGCEVALVGIQPAANAFDAPLSLPARQAVDAVIAGLVEILTPG